MHYAIIGACNDVYTGGFRMSENFEPIKRLPNEAQMPGTQKTGETSVRAFLYDTGSFEELAIFDLDTLSLETEGRMIWVHIDGLNDTERIKNIGRHFGLHPLVLEDILTTTQRPNFEDYGDYLFFIIKAIGIAGGRQYTEQISFAVGRNFVLSIQEIPGEPFMTVYEHLKNGRGPLRQSGADFLGYALFDTTIDNSITALHKVREKIDAIEDVMVDRPNPKLLHSIHQLRRGMLILPRTLRALADIASTCEHADLPLIATTTRPYFHDLHDHLNSVLDMTEVFRGILSGILDLYLSSMNNRMNEVMKTLTMISTIFIPLSFLAGVYGMNFRHMPELDWKWSYLAFWGLTVAIVGCMFALFKKKKWL